MCGRFTLTVNPADLQEAFQNYSFPPKFAPRYNIAPTQPILAIPNDERHTADFFLWGLIPMWAKDPSIGSRLINARAETLAEKPSFRSSLKYKRCLILADGFYEWRTSPGGKVKTPYFIHMNDRKPFAFAGLWDSWNSPDGAADQNLYDHHHRAKRADGADPQPHARHPAPTRLRQMAGPRVSGSRDTAPVDPALPRRAHDCLPGQYPGQQA